MNIDFQKKCKKLLTCSRKRKVQKISPRHQSKRLVPSGGVAGHEACRKKLRMTGVDIDRLIDGKIVEHGGAVNTFEALFEEGIIKPA